MEMFFRTMPSHRYDILDRLFLRLICNTDIVGDSDYLNGVLELHPLVSSSALPLPSCVTLGNSPPSFVKSGQ